MKIVFVGPSLFNIEVERTGLDFRPPAKQGDVLRAVVEGATAIGLIDGMFGNAAAVWHKELLYALSEGVHVIGGASMGALRAAECATFGMEPVGAIAEAYLRGETDDDALVALVHMPPELGCAPITEALVDMLATLDQMASHGVISVGESTLLREMAETTHFSQRVADDLLQRALPTRPELREAYRAYRISVKTQDALRVLERLRELPTVRKEKPANWSMAEPQWWKDAFAQASGKQSAIH